jgi:hypothetical protein
MGRLPTAPAGLGLDSQGAAGPETKRKEVSRRLAESSCARDRDRMAETRSGSGSAAYAVRVEPIPASAGRATKCL